MNEAGLDPNPLLGPVPGFCCLQYREYGNEANTDPLMVLSSTHCKAGRGLGTRLVSGMAEIDYRISETAEK